MSEGNYSRSFKRFKFQKEASSSSIKIKPRNKYSMQLSIPVSEELCSKKNLNNFNSLQRNETFENKKMLKENNESKKAYNSSKEKIRFHFLNKEEKEEEKENDKDKEKQDTSEMKDKISFRERLNSMRKKRAFFDNNTFISTPLRQKNSYININLRDNNEENSENLEKNNNILMSKRKQKKRLVFEPIKKNLENKNIFKKLKEKKFKNNRNNSNIINGIKEENIGTEISDTVKCNICQQKIVHPKMCPKCHHISCEKCLYNWFLKDQNKVCNYCEEPVNFYEYISVPFMETIVDFVEKVIYDKKKYSSSFQNYLNYNLNNDKNEETILNNNRNYSIDNCEIHNEPVYYYCINCNKKYCKTCFVFFGNEKDKHLNHKIIEYSNYKKINIPLLKKEEEKLEYNINYINDLIKQCNSFKTLYEFEKKTINDYISSIQKEFNKNIDEIMKNIDKKKIELKQSIDIYQKSKKDLDDYYKKINSKSITPLSTQYFADKIKKVNDKKFIREDEINELFTLPENINLKIYESKNEEINIDKYLNKKIKFGTDLEMIVDNKMKNSINISLNIPKDNKRKHFYKSIIYLIKKDMNIIVGYSMDDSKELKNFYSFIKKIQLEENECSVFEIKTIIYDFFFE